MCTIYDEIPSDSMPTEKPTYNLIDEKMVDIHHYFGGEILAEPVYYNNNIKGATDKCLVRLSVAEKLETALKLLPENLTFKVFDAWRPLMVQEELYKEFYNKISMDNPDWDISTIESETIKFVSKPGIDIKNESVHSTGGAIDLTIAYKTSGKSLDMGTAFDDFTDLSFTAAFENSKFEEIKYNRRMLYWTMLKAGFTNLPSEWWHYDYGDRFWSCCKGKPAIYCGIQSENIK